ncbi:UNVERIFIED_CONTAM: hypothetical protein ACS92_06735 [Bacillus cereus]
MVGVRSSHENSGTRLGQTKRPARAYLAEKAVEDHRERQRQKVIHKLAGPRGFLPIGTGRHEESFSVRARKIKLKKSPQLPCHGDHRYTRQYSIEDRRNQFFHPDCALHALPISAIIQFY